MQFAIKTRSAVHYCSYPFDLVHVELSPLRLLSRAITITVSAVVAILRIKTTATTDPPVMDAVLSVSEHEQSEPVMCG